MKRYVVFLLLLQCLYGLYAQLLPPDSARDYRAVLNIRGRVTKMSVSPDGKICMPTYLGNVYYTAGIDSNWHQGDIEGLQPYRDGDYCTSLRPWLDRVTFFNADTALLTGHLEGNYYRTTDGGRTWKSFDFGGKGLMYRVVTDCDGHAWMGTQGKTIYYSEDFGQHFQALKIPFKRDDWTGDRINSLFMADAQYGIVGSDENEILITKDNWKTAQNIPTPLEQGKITSEREYHLSVRNVFIWGDYWVAEQEGKYFYTRKDTIDWQSFPIQFWDADFDATHQQLWAIDDSLRLWVFTSPTQYQLLTMERPPQNPIDIKVVNGSLYMLLEDCRVCKANGNGLICRTPYTSDYSIPTPYHVVEGDKLLWGATGRQLFLTEADNPHWYREADLDFYVLDIKLLNDSVAILWDGMQNHLYSLCQHKAENYTLSEPLGDFLAYPITKVSITALGYRHSCIQKKHRIVFEVQQDSLLTSSRESLVILQPLLDGTEKQSEKKKLSRKEKQYIEKRISELSITISLPQLTHLLENINAQPEKKPKIQDFNITNEEVEVFWEKVTDNLAYRALHDTIVNQLEATDSATLYDILLSGEIIIWSDTYRTFTVELVNSNNDTCQVWSSYAIHPNPWNLPWYVLYHGLHFRCFDPGFSRYIKTCIPKGFIGREAFNNDILLDRIWDYYQKKCR